MPSLTVDDLWKTFEGRGVVRGVTFTAKAGEVVAVIGPSGCGKTTILRCILGEVQPDRGTIRIDGDDVTSIPVWKRGVGIVYQRYALFPHMTVAENVGYGLRIRRQGSATIKAAVDRLLDMVGLQAKADQYPERLSGGERQRVALARALAVKPRILLLDEAFTALDATTRHRVVQDVRAIVERLKVTTILVTHDQEEAFLFADRVVVVNEGRIVVEGAPEQVMAHPHPFIRDFVKMAVFQKGTVERDGDGGLCVPLESGGSVPIDIPGVKPGDYVQVIVKKTGERETIEVWRHSLRGGALGWAAGERPQPGPAAQGNRNGGPGGNGGNGGRDRNGGDGGKDGKAGDAGQGASGKAGGSDAGNGNDPAARSEAREAAGSSRAPGDREGDGAPADGRGGVGRPERRWPP